MAVQDDVRTFIVKDLGWSGSPDVLTDEFELIAEGALDSMGIFQLVTMLEERLGVEVDDDEFVPENFATIGAIARLVASKQRS